jgi:hypothetical protein
MYRPIARQWLDKHLPAERDSWQTRRYQEMQTTIRDNSIHTLLGSGYVFCAMVRPEAI